MVRFEIEIRRTDKRFQDSIKRRHDVEIPQEDYHVPKGLELIRGSLVVLEFKLNVWMSEEIDLFDVPIANGVVLNETLQLDR